MKIRQTVSERARRLTRALLAAGWIGAATVGAVPADACVADCDGNCQVDVAEILTAVQIALGTSPLERCEPLDIDSSRAIEVNEILKSVDLALNGCGKDFSFAPKESYAVGDAPRSLVVVDLDQDEWPDIVTANHGSNDISVLRNLGNGRFAANGSYRAGRIPLGIASGDFNGDGRRDVATANGGSGDVSVLLGSGDATFQPEQRHPAGPGARTILAADVDDNGSLDLIVAAPGATGIPLLLGHGDGQFTRVVVGSGFQPWWIAWGDVTGDGIADLVSANAESRDIAVVAGLPNGGFVGRNRIPLAQAPFSVAISDVDDDGMADLVTGNGRDSSLSLLLGHDGSFRPPLKLAVGPGPYPIHVVDVDNDTYLDLVTVTENTADGAVSIRRGRGRSDFEAEQAFAIGALPYAVTIADIDRDGALDLVGATGGMDQVVIRRRARCLAPPAR